MKVHVLFIHGAGDGAYDEDARMAGSLGRSLGDGYDVHFLYQGDEDETVEVEHLSLYVRQLPHATVRRLRGRNHQLNDDLSEVATDIKELDAR